MEKPVNNEENLYGLDKPKTLFVIDGIYKGKKSKQENSPKTDDNAGKPAEDENSEISEELDKGYSYVEAEKTFINRLQKYFNKGVEILKEKP